MSSDDLATLTRRDKRRGILLVLALIAVAFWVSAQFLQPAPARRIVLASGAGFGLYHQYAERYRQALARDGVVVEERMTAGAAENLRLLLDPKSDVQVAFLQGGIADPAQAEGVEMLASLYYEPLWVFYRSPQTLTRLTQLQGQRIAIGAEGSGTRAFLLPLLASMPSVRTMRRCSPSAATPRSLPCRRATSMPRFSWVACRPRSSSRLCMTPRSS